MDEAALKLLLRDAVLQRAVRAVPHIKQVGVRRCMHVCVLAGMHLRVCSGDPGCGSYIIMIQAARKHFW